MKEKKCILVCVTVQQGCVRLIRQGHDLALKNGAELHVMHVSANKNVLGTPENAAILDTLFSLAHEADADMDILYDQEVAPAIARHALQLHADTLIMGPDQTGTIGRVRALLPEDIQLISTEE